MRNTRQPLVGINNGRAGLMKPGATYNTARKRTKFEDGGMSTTEVPMDLLFSLEPLLLEAHLKTLSAKDKNVFMERYMPLADNMRRAALMQIAAKYPDVLEDFQEGEGEGEMENDDMEDGQASSEQMPTAQMGGLMQGLEPISFRGSYNQPSETSYIQPKPLQDPNYNAMFLDFATPATQQARSLTSQGKYDEAQAIRDQILQANATRTQMEKAGPLPRLYQMGGVPVDPFFPFPQEEKFKNTRAKNKKDLAQNPTKTSKLITGSEDERKYQPTKVKGRMPIDYNFPEVTYANDPSYKYDWSSHGDRFKYPMNKPPGLLIHDVEDYIDTYFPKASANNNKYNQVVGPKKWLGRSFTDPTNAMGLPKGDPTRSEYKEGGLTKSKAEKILHDGTINGKPITDKQRRYFAAVAFSDKRVKKQTGGAVDEWQYVAPPIEDGWMLSGIKSNRPVKANTTDIKANPQGTSAKPSGTRTTTKRAPVRQTAPSTEPAPQNLSNPAQNNQLSSQLSWETAPSQDGTIRSLRKPSWLENSRPAYSTTTAAIANTTKDPVYQTLTPRKMTATDTNRPSGYTPPTPLLTEAAIANSPYQNWKNNKSFGFINQTVLNTDNTEFVKSFSNGDSLSKYYVVSKADGVTKLPVHILRDAKTGKYTQIDASNQAELNLLMNTR